MIVLGVGAIVSGLVLGVGPDANLAEFDWIDRRPEEEGLAALLAAAAGAFEENPLEWPHPPAA